MAKRKPRKPTPYARRWQTDTEFFLARYLTAAEMALRKARLGLELSGELKYRNERDYWTNVASAIRWLQAHVPFSAKELPSERTNGRE